MHMLRTTQAKSITKVVKKFGNKISISNNYLRGTFTIKNYRKYSHLEEVDIIFEGEIHVNYNRKKDWYNSSIMTNPLPNVRVSKIKVNTEQTKKVAVIRGITRDRRQNPAAFPLAIQHFIIS